MSDTATPDNSNAALAALPAALAEVDAKSKVRRSVYCMGATLISLAGMLTIAFHSMDTELARVAVAGFRDIVQTIAALYVGGSVLDRSGILSLIGSRVAGGASRDK